MGNHQAALDWLEEAFSRHSGSLIWLNLDPRFDDIRDEPRFVKLVEDVGLLPVDGQARHTPGYLIILRLAMTRENSPSEANQSESPKTSNGEKSSSRRDTMSESEMNEAAGAGAGRFSHHTFTEKDDKTMIGRTNRVIKKASLCAGVAAALLLAPQLSPAQEKEHPKEHPEHPEDQAASEMTSDALAVAITDYIKQDAKLKGGFFLVYDAVDKKPLQLTLVKVHKDKLATLGDGVYFACTDMKTADGTVYDLDFMMKETDHGIRTTEVMVHKKSGEPRYAWKEKDGVWTRDKS